MNNPKRISQLRFPLSNPGNLRILLLLYLTSEKSEFFPILPYPLENLISAWIPGNWREC